MHNNDIIETKVEKAEEVKEVQGKGLSQDELDPEEIKIGFIVDCFSINVRKEPTLLGDILDRLPCMTKVAVTLSESTDLFYKIRTESGIEGFCTRIHVALLQ